VAAVLLTISLQRLARQRVLAQSPAFTTKG
jgi:hypothetical protein